MEARATERSGGNVSYAQHVIFGDPSEHFFVGGTFAHPLHVSLRARALSLCVCVRALVYGRPERKRQRETHTNRAIKRVVNRAGVLVTERKRVRLVL